MMSASDRENLIAVEVAGQEGGAQGMYDEVDTIGGAHEDREETDVDHTIFESGSVNTRTVKGGRPVSRQSFAQRYPKEKLISMQNCTFTVEEAIEKMGFGPFQIIITVFSGMLWLADAMELMLLSVLSPAVQCQWGLTRSEEATITSVWPAFIVKTDKHRFSNDEIEEQEDEESVQKVVFVGFLIGGLIWGTLSDAVGRKMTLLVVDLWILVCGILSAIKVSPDDHTGKAFGYPWLLICRFGVGVGAGGTAQSVTYYAEFLPQKARGYCLVFVEFWWAIGSMFGALLALGVMNTLGWHWYLGIATFPLFLVLFLFPFVPESARFYLMKGKSEKAKEVLNKIAWFNRKPCPQGNVVTVEEKEAITANQEISVSYNQETGVSFDGQLTPSILKTQEETPLLDDDQECDEETLSHHSMSKKQMNSCYRRLKLQAVTYLDVFKGGMWRTTVLLWILWVGCAWIYYGVVLLTTSIFQYENHCFSDTSKFNETQNATNETTECKDLSDSYYIRIFWTAVAELPGLVVTILIIEVLGRKKTMALEYAITMIGFFLLFVCTSPAVTTFFLFLIRAFATGVFQAVYVYTPEVYPTNVRAGALGLHTAGARVGALLTPFNAQVLFHRSDIVAVALYAVSCFVMVCVSLLLPIETKGKTLKDGTIH